MIVGMCDLFGFDCLYYYLCSGVLVLDICVVLWVLG